MCDFERARMEWSGLESYMSDCDNIQAFARVRHLALKNDRLESEMTERLMMKI